MCCDDDRQAEADYHRQQAAGQHHDVTVDVTIKLRVTVNLPGSTHTTEELYEAVEQCEELGGNDIEDLEEV